MLNKFSPKIIKFLLISVICFLLIFFNPKNFFSPIRTLFLEVAYPFQKSFYLMGRGIAEVFSIFGSIGEMKDENERLLRENNALVSELAALKSVSKENETLREHLNLAPKDKFELELCFVIGKDPEGLGSWLLIGKGSLDGIQMDMPVVVSGGILIGKIDEVGLDSARVRLLTDSTSAVNAVDLETGARGLIKGAYGLGMIMDMISQSDVLNEGDVVVTSGLGNEFPKGLLIGKVQEIKFSSDRLFQQAVVVPRIKYEKLDLVSVIKNK